MLNGAETDAARHEALSALVDGELESQAVGGACAAWRGDASARASWHAYQLIGDVLRSDDLASPAGHDAGFLAALRLRLDQEPVVLAPAPAVALGAAAVVPAGAAFANARQRQRRWSWMAPSAVAAGFVAVAGVLVVTRGPNTPQPVPLAAAPVNLPAVQAAASQAEVEAPLRVVAGYGPGGLVGDRYLRDARLDTYLAAHKQFAGSTVLGVPSGFLRNAVAEAPGR